MKDVQANIGVVVTTYNSPAWLEKVLWGYENQTDTNFQLLIADDGSDEPTQKLIETYKKSSTLNIEHIWHKDNGFRKTIILNKVIANTSLPYLIFTDGDCIPKNDFIAAHRQRALPGHFLSGGYYKLEMTPSQAITRDDIQSQRAFDFNWLHQQGQPKSFKRSKLTFGPTRRKLMEKITPTKATWNGMNSSAFTKDILAVNGFDERMQYGGLDREMGERMVNNGLKGIQIRYSAICLHLEHARGYKTPETLEKNRQIRDTVKKGRLIWSDYGIIKRKAD